MLSPCTRGWSRRKPSPWTWSWWPGTATPCPWKRPDPEGAPTMSDEFGVESVYAELLGRAPENKMEPRMEPLFRAMDILGEPNKAFASIHLTGTNGKTSTARIIEAGLRAHGLRTGRYTSPHLSKVT